MSEYSVLAVGLSGARVKAGLRGIEKAAGGKPVTVVALDTDGPPKRPVRVRNGRSTAVVLGPGDKHLGLRGSKLVVPEGVAFDMILGEKAVDGSEYARLLKPGGVAYTTAKPEELGELSAIEIAEAEWPLNCSFGHNFAAGESPRVHCITKYQINKPALAAPESTESRLLTLGAVIAGIFGQIAAAASVTFTSNIANDGIHPNAGTQEIEKATKALDNEAPNVDPNFKFDLSWNSSASVDDNVRRLEIVDACYAQINGKTEGAVLRVETLEIQQMVEGAIAWATGSNDVSTVKLTPQQLDAVDNILKLESNSKFSKVKDSFKKLKDRRNEEPYVAEFRDKPPTPQKWKEKFNLEWSPSNRGWDTKTILEAEAAMYKTVGTQIATTPYTGKLNSYSDTYWNARALSFVFASKDMQLTLGTTIDYINMADLSMDSLTYGVQMKNTGIYLLPQDLLHEAYEEENFARKGALLINATFIEERLRSNVVKAGLDQNFADDNINVAKEAFQEFNNTVIIAKGDNPNFDPLKSQASKNEIVNFVKTYQEWLISQPPPQKRLAVWYATMARLMQMVPGSPDISAWKKLKEALEGKNDFSQLAVKNQTSTPDDLQVNYLPTFNFRTGWFEQKLSESTSDEYFLKKTLEDLTVDTNYEQWMLPEDSGLFENVTAVMKGQEGFGDLPPFPTDTVNLYHKIANAALQISDQNEKNFELKIEDDAVLVTTASEELSFQILWTNSAIETVEKMRKELSGVVDNEKVKELTENAVEIGLKAAQKINVAKEKIEEFRADVVKRTTAALKALDEPRELQLNKLSNYHPFVYANVAAAAVHSFGNPTVAAVTWIATAGVVQIMHTDGKITEYDAGNAQSLSAWLTWGTGVAAFGQAAVSDLNPFSVNQLALGGTLIAGLADGRLDQLLDWTSTAMEKNNVTWNQDYTAYFRETRNYSKVFLNTFSYNGSVLGFKSQFNMGIFLITAAFAKYVGRKKSVFTPKAIEKDNKKQPQIVVDIEEQTQNFLQSRANVLELVMSMAALLYTLIAIVPDGGIVGNMLKTVTDFLQNKSVENEVKALVLITKTMKVLKNASDSWALQKRIDASIETVSSFVFKIPIPSGEVLNKAHIRRSLSRIKSNQPGYTDLSSKDLLLYLANPKEGKILYEIAGFVVLRNSGANAETTVKVFNNGSPAVFTTRNSDVRDRINELKAIKDNTLLLEGFSAFLDDNKGRIGSGAAIAASRYGQMIGSAIGIKNLAMLTGPVPATLITAIGSLINFSVPESQYGINNIISVGNKLFDVLPLMILALINPLTLSTGIDWVESPPEVETRGRPTKALAGPSDVQIKVKQIIASEIDIENKLRQRGKADLKGADFGLTLSTVALVITDLDVEDSLMPSNMIKIDRSGGVDGKLILDTLKEKWLSTFLSTNPRDLKDSPIFIFWSDNVVPDLTGKID